MVRLDDFEALKLLEQPQPPRYLGWTQEQWARIAGQVPGKYQATAEEAFKLRMDWLNSMQLIDHSKSDAGYAVELFYSVGRDNHRRGFDLTDDRAKGCG